MNIQKKAVLDHDRASQLFRSIEERLERRDDFRSVERRALFVLIQTTRLQEHNSATFECFRSGRRAVSGSSFVSLGHTSHSLSIAGNTWFRDKAS